MPRCTSLALPLLALVSLVACADKNADEYRKAHAIARAAQNQQVAGDYRGDVVSVKDQTYLGDASLAIQSDIRPINSQDGLSTEMQAVINAEIQFTAYSSIRKEFHNCQYDPDTHSLTCLDDARILKLKGTLNGTTLEGTIESEGQPLYGAHFRVVKGAPSSDVALIRSKLKARSAPSDLLTRVYEGAIRFADSASSRVALVVMIAEPTDEQAFNNIFAESKAVHIELNFESGLRIGIPNANFNESTGMLRGLTTVSDGTSNDLICSSTPAGLNCDMISSSKSYIFRGVAFTLSPNGAMSVHSKQTRGGLK